jgi:DNA-binding NarL/FixJ family response regulator
MSARLGQLAAGAGSGFGSGSGQGAAAAGGADASGAEALTPRELDVLRLLAKGQSNLEIARALVVREGTIKYHVKNILRKLGATSRADAVARYARAGRG